MSYILALIIFSAIVIFHELGHFLLAKWNGIEVIEFSLGMGPRLLSHVWGDTRYSLKLLPIGGSCQMVGEEEASDSAGAFGNKSVWARIAVVAAGPVFNFVLAWVLALIIVGSVGYDNTMVDIIPDSAAAEAGMEDGDQIISINGSRTWLYREVSLYSSLHQGQTATVVFERNGEKQTVVLTPKQSDTGAYLYGFFRTVQREKGGALETVGYSCAEIRYWLKATVESLKMLIGGQVRLEEMSGPVGIVSTIGDTYKESRVDGWYYVTMNMIMIAIFLSVNLGVMNLLPIPALDGGRLVFLILEAIRGKAIPQEKESVVHFTGFVLLMGLMAVILFSDLHKLFIK